MKYRIWARKCPVDPDHFSAACAASTALRISLRLALGTSLMKSPAASNTAVEYPLSGRVCLPPIYNLVVRSRPKAADFVPVFAKIGFKDLAVVWALGLV